MVIISLLYLVVGFLPCVLGQVTSNAQCTLSTYDWMFNSAGDSPCLVASQLGAVCNGGRYTLDPVPEGMIYVGPTPEGANTCRCNSVYYSLLSACAACQGRHWLNWSRYIVNCTTVYLTMFPQPLPLQARVPAWAYANVSDGDAFSLLTAQNDFQGTPESTLPVASVTSTALSLPTNAGTSSNPSPTDLSSNSSSSNSNAGAIAGGVIGAVVALAAIAGLVFFFLRRRKQASQKLASSEYSTPPYSGTNLLSDQMSFAPNGSYAQVTSPLKPYDPSDPSTYPVMSNLDSTTPPPANTNGYPFYDSPNQTGQRPAQMPSPANGHYTGAPEI